MKQINPHKKSTFAPAFLFLNKEKRKALETVYGFCRIIDDIADEPAQNPGKELEFWKREIELLYKNKPATFIAAKLLPCIKKFDLKKEHFLLIIEGVRQDLTKKRYETFKELEFYLYRVASAVGLLCIDIFGYKNPKTKEYAKYLGYAVQLTNIIRDAASDAKTGRIYIPLEDMKKFAVSDRDLLNDKMITKVGNLLKFETDRAKKYYALAEQTLPAQDRRSMLTARIMGSLYENLLKKIEKKDFDVFGKKIKLNKLEKIMAVLKETRRGIRQ